MGDERQQYFRIVLNWISLIVLVTIPFIFGLLLLLK